MILLIDLSDRKIQTMLVKTYLKEQGFGTKLRFQVCPKGVTDSNGVHHFNEIKVKMGDDIKDEEE